MGSTAIFRRSSASTWQSLQARSSRSSEPMERANRRSSRPSAASCRRCPMRSRSTAQGSEGPRRGGVCGAGADEQSPVAPLRRAFARARSGAGEGDLPRPRRGVQRRPHRLDRRAGREHRPDRLASARLHAGGAHHARGRLGGPHLRPGFPRVLRRLMAGFLDTVVQGILLGGTYALFALGQSLLFGVMRLTNTAHGDFIVLAAFAASSLAIALGLPAVVASWVALVMLLPIAFAAGYGLQRVVLNGTLGKDPLPSLIVTFGLAIVI